jgi:hypothetical protein
MRVDEPVYNLIKQLLDASAESRYTENAPEVVIYSETSEVSKFLSIKSVDYDAEKNRIRITVMNTNTT